MHVDIKVAPDAVEYVPVEHGKQYVSATKPRAEEYFPAEQLEQYISPIKRMAVEYLPAVHRTQTEAPELEECVPGEQARHSDRPW
jgi:hypothetical protein